MKGAGSAWKRARDGVRGVLSVLDGTVDGTFLGPLRVTLGILLFWQALVSAQDLVVGGYFGDVFHMSLLPERLVATKPVFTVLVAARCVLAALVVIGMRPRLTLMASGMALLYTLFSNTLQFHHNRYSLALYAILLSLTPCDRSFLLLADEAVVPNRVGRDFGVLLCQIQVGIVYLASGGSKLVDVDWRGGTVLHERFVLFGPEAESHGVPHAILAILATPLASSILAKLAIFTEFSLPFFLFSRRTRAQALYGGLLFHGLIQLTSRVEIFSILAIAMYAVFVTGDVRARAFRYDPTNLFARSLAVVVRATDWFARFDVKPWEPDGLAQSHSVVVVRRDGSRATRLAAFAMVARAIPLFFIAWGPLAFATSFTKGGDVGADV